jgi:TAK1-binding protein 1
VARFLISNFRKNFKIKICILLTFLGKTGYKDCEIFSNAKSEPILSDPEIVGSITLDDSCRFFMLLSAGLCQTLCELYSPDLNNSNKEIVQIILEQFRMQSTLMGVAQGTISRISQLHHDLYMQQLQENKSAQFNQREQMTLLIRNFNYPMPNALNKRERHDSTSTVTATNMSYSNTTGTECSFHSNATTTSSGRYPMSSDDCKIKPYVDFSDYYRNVELAREKNQLPKNIVFD